MNDDSDSSEEQKSENVQNEEHKAQGEKNVEVEGLSKTYDGNNKVNREVSNEDSPSEKDKGQEERSVEADEGGDIPLPT